MTAQRFHRGDHVHVSPDAVGWTKNADGTQETVMSTPDAKTAIVMYSYADRYGGGNHTDYSLLWPHGGESSWHNERCLTLIRHGTEDDIRAVLAEAEARKVHERDLAWIAKNWLTIRDRCPGATCEELMRRVGISNPWGSQGEGVAWYANWQQTFAALDPILSDNPPDPAEAIAHVHLSPIDVRIE